MEKTELQWVSISEPADDDQQPEPSLDSTKCITMVGKFKDKQCKNPKVKGSDLCATHIHYLKKSDSSSLKRADPVHSEITSDEVSSDERKEQPILRPSALTVVPQVQQPTRVVQHEDDLNNKILKSLSNKISNKINQLDPEIKTLLSLLI